MREKLSSSDKNKIIIRAGRKCTECSLTHHLQVHHTSYNPVLLICLCAKCHSRKHLNVPREAFFSNHTNGHYWENSSAISIARQLGCHCRTITRHAQKLGIFSSKEISLEDKKRLVQDIKCTRRGRKPIYEQYYWRRPKNYWNN